MPIVACVPLTRTHSCSWWYRRSFGIMLAPCRNGSRSGDVHTRHVNLHPALISICKFHRGIVVADASFVKESPSHSSGTDVSLLARLVLRVRLSQPWPERKDLTCLWPHPARVAFHLQLWALIVAAPFPSSPSAHSIVPASQTPAEQ